MTSPGRADSGRRTVVGEAAQVECFVVHMSLLHAARSCTCRKLPWLRGSARHQGQEGDADKRTPARTQAGLSRERPPSAAVPVARFLQSGGARHPTCTAFPTDRDLQRYFWGDGILSCRLRVFAPSGSWRGSTEGARPETVHGNVSDTIVCAGAAQQQPALRDYC